MKYRLYNRIKEKYDVKLDELVVERWSNGSMVLFDNRLSIILDVGIHLMIRSDNPNTVIYFNEDKDSLTKEEFLKHKDVEKITKELKKMIDN